MNLMWSSRSVAARWTITPPRRRRTNSFRTTWTTFMSTRRITSILRTRARMRRTSCRRCCRTETAAPSSRRTPPTPWTSTRRAWTGHTLTTIADSRGLTIQASSRAWAGTVQTAHHRRRRAVARATGAVELVQRRATATTTTIRFRRWSSISGRRCTSGRGATSTTTTRRTTWRRWVHRMTRRTISGRDPKVWTWSRLQRSCTTGERRTRFMIPLWKKVVEEVTDRDNWLFIVVVIN